MPQNIGDRLATTPSHVHTQSMYHCALCINYHINIITGIVFYCIIYFRRINHLVVKNHLHSSSGVRVVSSTVHIKEKIQCSGVGQYVFDTVGHDILEQRGGKMLFSRVRQDALQWSETGCSGAEGSMIFCSTVRQDELQ
jgi:hypothetical protein